MLSPATIWLIIAVILLIVELSTGTFYVLCFAIGAFASAILAYFLAYEPGAIDMAYFSTNVFFREILLFVVLSFILSFFLPKYFQKSKVDTKVGMEEHYGKETKILKKDGILLVKLSGSQWRIKDEKKFSEGDLVIVQKMEGTKVVVEKMENIESMTE